MLEHVLVVIESVMKSLAALIALEPRFLLVLFLVSFFVRFLKISIY